MRLWLRVTAAAACFAAATATVARADNYPSKPITIIVPASPGGVTDVLARILTRTYLKIASLA